MNAFPKIFTIGQDYIRNIFKGPVEITEKIDGSQFAFGMIKGELFMRSKGKQMWPASYEKMFEEAVVYVQTVTHKMPPDMIFYAEYLKKQKHNSLAYSRIPQNHLILFGIMMFPEMRFHDEHSALCHFAEELGIESVPLLYYGQVGSAEMLRELMDKESILGGPKMEGVVVKNYHQPFLLGGQPIPIMAGKFVSESFKEVHREGWSKEHTTAGKWDTFKQGYRTEVRWEKAIQHLRDSGELINAPQDIGKLMKEIARDVAEEEKEIIKDWLWNHFGKDVIRTAQAGFPEYYKQKLLERGFGE